MSFTLEKYPNEPIIVTTLHEDYDLMSEMSQSDQATLDILEAVDEPHTGIMVFNRKLKLDEIFLGANTVARGETPLWHHPMMKQIIFVTTDETLKLTAKGMKADLFGGLDIPVFNTLEEALAYTRSKQA